MEATAPVPLTDTPTHHTSGAERNILVIGGGIAGCSVARALAERGWDVMLLTRAVTDGASGNAAAVLFPQLSKRWLPSTAWNFAAEDFSRRLYTSLQILGAQTLIESPGILRLPRHEAEAAALRQINDALGLDAAIVRWVEANEASEQAGVALTTGAAFLPQGSWVNPVALCANLLQHPRIQVRAGVAVRRLVREGAGWRAHAVNGEDFYSAQMCLANGFEAAALLPVPLALSATAGQVSTLSADQVAAPLRSILCHKGYVIPLGTGYLIGATYDREDLSGRVTEENHQKNASEVAQFLPGWMTGPATEGRTSLRATTPDRLPYVGQLEPGLWLSLGHGSRGMISAPLAAEIIASKLSGEMPPVGPELYRVVDPQRMLTHR
ncbi:MAG: FAD-dependent 5-carboxymethylaminomethyl-2-thiouridine(34) oxidoreductase MnmC [Rickettsiales bacterium]